jgi:hypothetical protein
MLLHRDATTTVLTLVSFLLLTFSFLCVLGRMWTRAKLLLVHHHLHNVRSQSTSCNRGCCMSRCCPIRLWIACVSCTCFIKPNSGGVPMLDENSAVRQRQEGQQETTSLFLPCSVSMGSDGPRMDDRLPQCASHYGVNHGQGLCCFLPSVPRVHQQACPRSFCECAMQLHAVLHGW